MPSSQPTPNRQTKIIAIDGPAGAGKSTIAKQLAKILRYSYLDTGAMYRALTYKAINEHINLESEEALVPLAKRTHIDLEDTLSGVRVLLDGVDVSEPIRSVDVTNDTMYVSSKPKVREIMVNWQRAIGEKKNVVIEGRDTGTVVFPHADFKIYLDADLAERARRRSDELKKKGTFVEQDLLIHQINERDNRDMNRQAGPLKKATDAIVINSTNMTIDAVVSQILQIIHKHA